MFLKNKKILTWILFVISFLAFISLAISFINKYCYSDIGMVIDNLDESETKRVAVNLFFSRLESIGNISLALIGILWSFIIFRESRINIQRCEQKLLFILTNLYFLCSFSLYIWSHMLYVTYMFFHRTIDLQAPIVNIFTNFQILFFTFGLISLCITILMSLCCKVKENK